MLVFPFLFFFPKPTAKTREDKSHNAYIYDHEKEEPHLLWKYSSFDAFGISCQRFKLGSLGSIKKKVKEEKLWKGNDTENCLLNVADFAVQILKCI